MIVAAPIVGAAGKFAAITFADAADATDVPAAFVAVTEHVYVFKVVRPETMTGLDVIEAEPITPPLLDTQLAK